MMEMWGLLYSFGLNTRSMLNKTFYASKEGGGGKYSDFFATFDMSSTIGLVASTYFFLFLEIF